MCPYVYETAVSPHLASKLEGNPIDFTKLMQAYNSVLETYDYVTAEGSGGILCPLRHDGQEISLTDFVKAGELSCLIVADAGLGTINSVVLTHYYMMSHNISVKGIIFNNFEPGNRLHEDNLEMCEDMTGLKVLACVKKGDTDLDMSFESLEALYE